MPYFKQSNMVDAVDRVMRIVQDEPDIHSRLELASDTMTVFSEKISSIIARSCYDTYLAGVPTDVIAVRLGISQRAVKRFIKAEAERVGVRNPLATYAIGAFIDIRDRLTSN